VATINRRPDNDTSKTTVDLDKILLGSIGTIVSLIVGFAALNVEQLVTAALFILAVIPWLAFHSAWAKWPGWKFVLAAVVSATALTAGVWRWSDPSESSPVSSVPVVLTGAINESQGCPTYSGNGKAPDGSTIVAAHKKAGAEKYVFKKADELPGPRWSVTFSLGTPNDRSDVGKLYSVVVFVVDTDWVNQMMTKNVGQNRWTSPELPPGSPPGSPPIVSKSIERKAVSTC
jgi:hypothetical protein